MTYTTDCGDEWCCEALYRLSAAMNQMNTEPADCTHPDSTVAGQCVVCGKSTDSEGER